MGSVKVENLALGYEGPHVLQGIDLQVAPATVLALVGPNGAGKTTLLRALARQLRPREGIVYVEGRDVWQQSVGQMARQVGLVPQQEEGQWPLTVAQVVALGRTPHRGWFLPLTVEDRAVVDRILEQTDLAALRDRPITALSGGELRRVLIARALAQEPRVLLLDEPTASLDLRFQGHILGLVRDLAHRRELAVVVSIHDLNLAGLYADRIALVAQGRLWAVGTPAEVLTPERLSQAYGVPVTVVPHPVYGTPLVVPALERDRIPRPSG